MVERHLIHETTSPTHRVVICSCGWSHLESRRGQNARAAIAKLNKARRQHERAYEGKNPRQ